MWISALNLNLETPGLKPQRNWMGSIFCLLVSQQLSTLLFGSVASLSRETWIFELISQSFPFYAQQQKRVFKRSFSKLGFYPNLILQTLKEIHFKPEKGHLWFTLKGPLLPLLNINCQLPTVACEFDLWQWPFYVLRQRVLNRWSKLSKQKWKFEKMLLIKNDGHIGFIKDKKSWDGCHHLLLKTVWKWMSLHK